MDPLAALREDFKKLDTIVRGDGNGTPGLAARLRSAETTLEEVQEMLDSTLTGFKTTLDKLVKADEARQNRVAGRWDTVGWVKWGLRAAAALVALLAYSGYSHLVSVLDRIATVVNAIPPLP